MSPFALFVASAICTSAPSGWVASLNAPSLLARGVELQAERYLPADHWSAALSLSARWPVSGDYDGLQLGAGAELRRWVWRSGPRALSHDARLGGLFLSARVEASRTELWRADAATSRGVAFQLQPSVRVGYRFIFFDHLELTPALGPSLSILRIASASAAPLVRPNLVFGLSLGAIL